MTGYHTGHAQSRGNARNGGSTLGSTGTGNYPLAKGTTTIGMVLKKAGYYTAAIGKWGLGRFENSGSPHGQGFDHFFGYVCQLQAHTRYPNHLWRNGSVVAIPENDAKWGGSKHSHDLMTEEALSVIAESRKNVEQPFFLDLAYAIPHVSIQATEEAMAEYADEFDEPREYGGSATYVAHKKNARRLRCDGAHARPRCRSRDGSTRAAGHRRQHADPVHQ